MKKGDTGKPEKRTVHVVALALRDEQGQVLVQQRPIHKHQGGLWEFPGGKVEAAESAEIALRREIREELGIDITKASESPQRLIRLRHNYPETCVDLDVWQLNDARLASAVQAREGQPLAWYRPDSLLALPMPAADRPVVNALRLPDRYWITPALAASPSSVHKATPQAITAWLDKARQRLEQGVPMVQFRSKTVPASSRALVLKALHGWCRERNIPLVYNGEPGQAKAMLEYGIADGLHLGSQQLMTLRQRPVEQKYWLSASVHNHDEIQQANRLGVDFVSLSPVLATPSHPHAEPLGWDGFARLVAMAGMPVYALGGMQPGHIIQVRAAGGQGVAGIRLGDDQVG